MHSYPRALSICLILSFGCMTSGHKAQAQPGQRDEVVHVGLEGLPALPIGRKVEPFQLLDFRGKKHALEDFEPYPILVIAFLGTECPLVKLYGPRLEEMAKHYKPLGVGFLGMNANSQDSITEIAAYARKHGISFPMLKDLGNRVADQMGAKRTPEVFILDQQRVIRYWGRIDDQYGVGYVRAKPEQHDLKTALEELLDGQSVSSPITQAVGCLIGRARKPRADAQVTYSKQISRILQNNCVECHRTGEIAPFQLTEYSEVAGWAEMIEEVVRQERMPPWHASPKHGSFVNDRRLSEKEKQLLYRWVEAGAPEGDSRNLPEPKAWTTGWQLPRKPDFESPISNEPFVVPAEGAVKYQYFQIDPQFEEDKWVQAIEIKPGNRAVVHHILMFAGDQNDLEINIRRKFHGGLRGFDGAFIPGQTAQMYPEGTALKISAGSQLIFQVHYTPIGSEQLDQSRVGILFADRATVQYEIRTSSAANESLRIPAHAAAHRVEAGSPRLPANARLIALTPHMHLRGKSFFYEAVYPDGQREPLLNVPRYDFNWQMAYQLQTPLNVPQGTRIHCVAHFDNSEENLANPDPTKEIRWGPQTWDEMMIGYFSYTVPIGSDTDGEPTARRVDLLFDHLDRNSDNHLTRGETPKKFRWMFDRLDRNQDGELSIREFEALEAVL